MAISWRYDIWAIDCDRNILPDTTTQGIKGKQRAMDQALTLFSRTPQPWRVVVQPRVHKVNGTSIEHLIKLSEQRNEQRTHQQHDS